MVGQRHYDRRGLRRNRARSNLRAAEMRSRTIASPIRRYQWGLLAVSALALAGLTAARSEQAIVYGPAMVTTPPVVSTEPLSDEDEAMLRQAMNAARAGDSAQARIARDSLSDPVARKLALWMLVDGAPQALTFLEADGARRDLAGWPRAGRRQAAAERLIKSSGLGPEDIVRWFDGAQPQTAEGAMALGSALRASGRSVEATDLLRRFWRETVFEAEPQRQYLSRFGSILTPEDHSARADLLLYGQQGPAAKDMLALLPEDERAQGEMRLRLRSGAKGVVAQLDALPAALRDAPGVVFERAAYLRRRNQEDEAIRLVADFPVPPSSEAASRIWTERRGLIAYALRNGDHQSAYRIAANAHLPVGPDAAEAAFYAGWIALSRMKNPDLAARHFSELSGIGASPITRARAYYWQGRAAEAQGDLIGAQALYAEGARFQTTFYGQLAAEKVGVTTLDIGKDPEIGPADRARFDGREPVRAARMLANAGEHDLFRAFVLNIDDTLPTAQEAALLVDLARAYGDPDLAMRAVRTAAQRGYVLPERGYPLLRHPEVPGAAEPAYVLSIARQESNFDPKARSGPGARGLMQIMPKTGAHIARNLGEPFSTNRLLDPDYNLRLGAVYLGHMVDTFGGSYAMASAAYNAGPGRPADWANVCGDPRGGGADPVDFIECIPFSETRNYVMRTLETMLIYRARLNGGRTPLNLSTELRRPLIRTAGR